jgi:predicted dienelactone hydrolase
MRTNIFRCLIFFLLCSCRYNAAEEPQPPPLESRKFNVGFKIVDIEYEKDGQSAIINVAVWYPTDTETAPHNYGGLTNGNIAIDAVPLNSGHPYPLLFFSHGYGGCGFGAVFLCETLAARGWIVAAPDHHDKHSVKRIKNSKGDEDYDRKEFLEYVRDITESSPKDRGKFLYRLDEFEAVLNKLPDLKEFRDIADKKRIAVGGHSFGGYTALGFCGPIKERLNPNIKALLIFSSGACGYLYTQEELSSVKIPSMIFYGEREKKQLRGNVTILDIHNNMFNDFAKPKYLLELKNGSHFSFNNCLKDGWMARLFSGTEEQFDVIRRYSTAFLERYTAGQLDSEQDISKSDPMLTRFSHEKRVKRLEKIKVKPAPPKDFQKFWEETKARIKNTPLVIQREKR